MKAILSLLFLAILIFCTWSGYKKGLILGIAGFLAFVVSVYSANLLSQTYSGEIVDALRPFASGYIEVNVVDEQVRPAMGMTDTGLSTKDFMAQNSGKELEYCIRIYNGMGIYETTGEQLAQEAVAYSASNELDLTDAVVEVLCIRIAYVLGFLLAFAMVLIVLTVVINIPNLAFKIPNHEMLNDLGGVVMGFVQGVCLLTVFGWALKFTGLVFPQDSIANTFLVSWFMDSSLLVHILGV